MNRSITLILSLLFTIILCISLITLGSAISKKNRSAAIEDASESIGSILTKALEEAYMEGQVDALSGDVRVEKFGDDWTWIKSPWDESIGEFPIVAAHTYLSEYKE
jgi:hypothetical protein